MPRAATPIRRKASQQGSSLSFMQKQLLDPYNVALGVLNPLDSGQGLRNQDIGRCDLCPRSMTGRSRNGPARTSA